MWNEGRVGVHQHGDSLIRLRASHFRSDRKRLLACTHRNHHDSNTQGFDLRCRRRGHDPLCEAEVKVGKGGHRDRDQKIEPRSKPVWQPQDGEHERPVVLHAGRSAFKWVVSIKGKTPKSGPPVGDANSFNSQKGKERIAARPVNGVQTARGAEIAQLGGAGRAEERIRPAVLVPVRRKDVPRWRNRPRSAR